MAGKYLKIGAVHLEGGLHLIDAHNIVRRLPCSPRWFKFGSWASESLAYL
jgi:hypothetical protein